MTDARTPRTPPTPRLGPSGGARRPAWLREIVVIDTVLLVVLALLLLEALQLGPSSRRFPVWVISIVAALVAIDLVRELVPRLHRVEPAAALTGTAAEDVPATAEEQIGAAQEAGVRPDPGLDQWLVLGWVVLLTLLMAYVHYTLVVPIFLLGFLRWVRHPWRVVLPIALGPGCSCGSSSSSCWGCGRRGWLGVPGHRRGVPRAP